MFTTYIYDGSFEGLITSVYEAFYLRLPAEQIYITDSNDDETLDFFNSRINVISSKDKSDKVLSSLISKTSYDVYINIYYVYLSCLPEKGNLILRYIKLCFALGKNILYHISHPVVCEVNRVSRRVSRETQKLLGFVRFQELKSGALFSRITPENNQLELLAPHFSERLFQENWIIYDAKRRLACVHPSEKEFMITDDIPDIISEGFSDDMNTAEEEKYCGLWKTFFNTIGIKERQNPTCQRNLMPKRYWENMPEVRDLLKK